ncbi:MAG: hypothetical protein HY904_19480 [Deltaproteobacteria bacterium]|nr:hypothetical protein [Deltaproteobacteria bacterium]
MDSQSENSWHFMPSFRVPEPSWDGANSMVRELRDTMEAERESNEQALRVSDAALMDVGGDPCRENWWQFRPLRLSREEDWSDWLAWLLSTSTAGTLGHGLLGQWMPGTTPVDFVRPQVLREHVFGDYRTDIVLKTASGRFAQVEVKLWDKHWEKTEGTGAEVRKALKIEKGNMVDVILAPAPAIQARQGRMTPREVEELPYKTLDWGSVASALRRTLHAKAEATPWRVWARTFAGAMEQRLLGALHVPASLQASARQLAVAARFIHNAGKGGA